MARLYKLTDRLKYKVGEVTVEISPLDYHAKALLSEHIIRGQNGDVKELVAGAVCALKHGLKSITGVEIDDKGTPFELKFEDKDQKALTDDCVSDLMNLQESTLMSSICIGYLNGVPTESMLPKGVSLVKEGNPPAKNGKKSKG